MPIKFGVSYIGNRHLNHFETDLKEMGSLVDSIVLMVSEWDYQYCRKTLKKFVALAHKYNKKVIADPWRIFNVFGGEEISSFPRPNTLTDKKFVKYMKSWVDYVYKAGFDSIFLDETKGKNLVEFIETITKYAKNYKLNTIVCVLPRTRYKYWETIIQMPSVDHLSISPYFIWKHIKFPLSYFKLMAKRITDLGNKYNKMTSIWFQGFNIKDRFIDSIVEAINYAYIIGQKNYFVWSYKGTHTMDIAVESPIKYWETITNKIKELKKLED